MEMTEAQEEDIKPNIAELELLLEAEQLSNNVLTGRTTSSPTSNSKAKKHKTTKSKNVSPKKYTSPGVCSNCNNDFRSQEDICVEIAGNIGSETVSNASALVYIYESKGRENCAVAEQSVFLRNEDNQLAMCRKCSSNLAKLYKALKQFSQLCHLQSSISQKIDELEILQANIHKESLNAKLSRAVPNTIDNFVDVKVEATDIFCENNDEDFLLRGYDSDIPNYIDDTFECDDNFDNYTNNGGHNSDLPTENHRPKRNVRNTTYSDYFTTNEPEEDPSLSSSDSDDEEFRPPSKSNNIRKRNKNEKSSNNDKRNKHVKDQSEDCNDGPMSQSGSSSEEDSHTENKSSRIRTKSNAAAGSKISKSSIRSGASIRRRNFKKGESDTCPDCSKHFMDPASLRKHMRIHTNQDDDKLTCKECSKKFSREHHVARHMIQVHSAMAAERKEAAKKAKEAKANDKRDVFKEGESDTCPYCSKVFLNPRCLSRHVRVHTDEDDDKLTCTVCFKKFTREYHKTRHMVDVHKVPPPPPKTGSKIRNKSELAIKKESEAKMKKEKAELVSHVCPVCTEVFNFKYSEFKEHIKSHNVKCPYTCSICGKAFEASSRLKQHMIRTHKQGNTKEFVCQVCNAGFGYSYLRLCHQRSYHSVPNNMALETLQLLESVGLKEGDSKKDNNNTFQCTLCEKSYTRKDRLSIHMLTHTSDAPFSCDICSKRFLQKRSLLRHKLLHNDQNPFRCKVCSRFFSRADHLKRHMEKAHQIKASQEAQCDICGKVVKYQYRLKLHKLTHTKDRPFKCDICGKGFNHPSSVSYHQRVHSDERQFCCSTCGRTFKRAGHLRDHEALHLDLPKPYKCEVENCGKAFSRRTHLRKHAVVHGEKSYVCELCGTSFNRVDNLKFHHRVVHLKDPTAKRAKRPSNKTFKGKVEEHPEQMPFAYFYE